MRIRVPIFDSEKVQLLCEQINLVLLLSCEVVVRFLHELELLADDLNLSLKLIVLLAEGISLLGH